jgi:hypothetical protein
MGVWYCTREDVMRASDVAITAYRAAAVDRLIEASSRGIEALCHRDFYPTIATRYFDWPTQQSPRSWRLWLDRDELLAVSSLSSGGVVLTADDYLLKPYARPPYSRVEINLAGSAAFGGGPTHQRDITINGTFGACTDVALAGALAEVLDSSETQVEVSTSAIGVGDLLLIDDERMQVTDKSMIDTGQTLQTPLTANKADVLVAVTDSTGYAANETLLLDAERMLIVDIAGNNLIVKRAWDGSVLAAHTGSTIYAPRALTVTRAQLGTTAATHNNGATIYRHAPPALVRRLAIAETQVALMQEDAAYARTVGSGDATRVASAGQLNALREDVYTAHGRKVRKRVA